MRIGFYTWGAVGGGHIARALAVRRGLERAGVDAEFRVFYGLPEIIPPNPLDVVPLRTSRRELAHSEKARNSATAQALLHFAPELLLVDIAWEKLRHILPLPACEVWLLLRWYPPVLLEELRGPGFDPKLYARVIAIEPIAPSYLSDRIEPIVVCNPDECLPDSALRDAFGVEPGKPITLVVQAGKQGECEELVRRETERNEGFHIIPANLHSNAALFPMAPYFRGANRIVGGAGYNLYWETRWLDVAARTELRAFERLWDDQTPRMAAEPHTMRQNGADMLARQIAGR